LLRPLYGWRHPRLLSTFARLLPDPDTSGLRAITVGMAVVTSGFQGAGFILPGLESFGFRDTGRSVTADGSGSRVTGDKDPIEVAVPEWRSSATGEQNINRNNLRRYFSDPVRGPAFR
jgi:hypothetical protein